MKISLIIILSFISLIATAKETPNGGDVIVCYNKKGEIESVRLADYYDAIYNKEWIDYIDFGKNSEQKTFKQKVEYALNRLSLLNPSRARLYLSWFNDFFKEGNFKWVEKLSDIPDTGDMEFPQNCEIEQAATHKNPELPNEVRWKIVKRHFEKLDSDHQAGLILHELAYREASNQKLCIDDGYSTNCISFHKDSRKVRYFNAMISSNKMANWTTQQLQYANYNHLVQESKLASLDINGFEMLPTFYEEYSSDDSEQVLFPVKIEYYPDQTPKFYNSNNNYLISAKGDIPNACLDIDFYHTKVCIDQYDLDEKIKFHPNGLSQEELKVQGRKLELPSKIWDITPHIKIISESESIKVDSIRLNAELSINSLRASGDITNTREEDPESNFFYKIQIPNLPTEYEARTLYRQNLELAQNGTIYMQNQMRFIISDESENIGITASNSYTNGNITEACYYDQNQFFDKIKERQTRLLTPHFCGSIDNVILYHKIKADEYEKTCKREVTFFTSENKAKEIVKKRCTKHLQNKIPKEYKKYFRLGEASTSPDYDGYFATIELKFIGIPSNE